MIHKTNYFQSHTNNKINLFILGLRPIIMK